MAEGDTVSKMGEGSNEINNLNDKDFKILLEEAFSMKSTSFHGKSTMLQKLLREMKEEDEDRFESSVQEMKEVLMKSKSSSVVKKRSERKRRDDQRNSAAARTTQGGSLQNLSRKQDIDIRSRGKLQKSGSVNSFTSAIDDKPQFLTSLIASSTSNGPRSNSKSKTRSRSQVIAEKDWSCDATDCSIGMSVSSSKSSNSLEKKDICPKVMDTKIKKCNYGSLSFDSASEMGLLSSKSNEKSNLTDHTLEKGRKHSQSLNFEPTDTDQNKLKRNFEGIEMMEIDHSDEDCNGESTPLLCDLKKQKCGTGKINGKKVHVKNGDNLQTKTCNKKDANISRNSEEVDKVITCTYFQSKGETERKSHSPTIECTKESPYPRSLQLEEEKAVQSILETVSLKPDDNIRGKIGDLSDVTKLGSFRSQLDVNGNPLDDTGTRNLLNLSVLQRSGRREGFDSTDFDKPLTDSEKRRKHKRSKANSTLKEMKAGEISGNRGNDPVESLVEFINSSDKKSKQSAKTVLNESLTKRLTLKDNKIHMGKTRKQEKENNKRNLPELQHCIDGKTSDVIVNMKVSNHEGLMYDFLNSEKQTKNSIKTNNFSVDKKLCNQEKISLFKAAAENDIQISYTPVVHSSRTPCVKKAHSWESPPITTFIGDGSVVRVHQTIRFNSMDGCDEIDLTSPRVITVPQPISDDTTAVSSFVKDFYAVTEVPPQVFEESEFHVVTKKQRRNRHSLKSDGYFVRNKRASSSGTSSLTDDREFCRIRRHYNRAEDAILLAGLPLSHRSQRSGNDTRRKSTSSMPPSDHSSVDNSDLDSVHSLPVKSTTSKPNIAKTSSSSSSTPQASYADITKMSTPPISARCQPTISPLQKSVNGLIENTIPIVNNPVCSVQTVSLASPPAVGESCQEITSPDLDSSSPIARTPSPNDLDASVKEIFISHWASYPTLAEASGKNSCEMSSLGGSTRSSLHIEKNQFSDSDMKTLQFGVPLNPQELIAVGFVPSNPNDSTINSQKGNQGNSKKETVSNIDINLCPKNQDKVNTVVKFIPDTPHSASGSQGVVVNSMSSPSSSQTQNCPADAGAESRGAMESSSLPVASGELPQQTDRYSSKPETLNPKPKTKQNKKRSSKTLPAVIIFDNYEPGSTELGEVTFGFEVNEQLLQMTEEEGGEPSFVQDNSLSAKPTSEPVGTVPASVTENPSVPANVVVGEICINTNATSADVLSSSSGLGGTAEISTSGECYKKPVHENAPQLPQVMAEDESSSFNYTNVVDYIGLSWDGIVQELEKEVKRGSGEGQTKVQYYKGNEEYSSAAKPKSSN